VDFSIQTAAMELFADIIVRANAACVPHVCAVTGQSQQSVVQLGELLCFKNFFPHPSKGRRFLLPCLSRHPLRFVAYPLALQQMPRCWSWPSGWE
jgi:hypothetical protein